MEELLKLAASAVLLLLLLSALMELAFTRFFRAKEKFVDRLHEKMRKEGSNGEGP